MRNPPLSEPDDHMLAAMFSGRMPIEADKKGFVVIDRDGRYFHYILNHLRDGSVPLPTQQAELEALLVEAKYFLLADLQREVEAKLCECVLTTCAVPMVVSEEHDAKLVQLTGTGLPLVKLSCNRSMNRFSYTATATEAFLRHIELFDKLASKFHGRILYAKDVSGRNGRICTWSFFGKGRFITEVNCASIVYAPDRRQTKIEFPEARLYEENMNMLLYEPGRPDPAETLPRCIESPDPTKR
ncbi:potassium channel tetramerisation domain containing 13 [Salpingoeca rosetta]|uniref:Potassium channel tetramerisation domain containing 13 n=1 Tax=Salpingoeca rosetta (strain ATCC 50818 / BSB-021) TaxID=946362 RepID=F2UFP8_SALR5|nr:potassium channel tetramerisation domain containing 13 [Salpingoeca rosetta]EGD75616.1 potassium channel tetramerisation domain containing 13 [Salpingoeca rosetta]|eukprot:XP_004992073.1 potassium channel tetramerisation domain containing 13 [Salpingoeca rosetta]